jgi:hypothetical protein
MVQSTPYRNSDQQNINFQFFILNPRKKISLVAIAITNTSLISKLETRRDRKNSQRCLGSRSSHNKVERLVWDGDKWEHGNIVPDRPTTLRCMYHLLVTYVHSACLSRYTLVRTLANTLYTQARLSKATHLLSV